MDYDPPPVDPCSTLKAKLARLNIYISREREQAGANAIQLEDQVMPKKCGHFAKSVVARSEAVERAHAVEARQNPDFQIVARTELGCATLQVRRVSMQDLAR
jgi:2-methylisocitrate lyase-like PEP mutase family enzyme